MGVRLRGLITKLVRDASEHVADYGMGEVPALMQRCHEALVALATRIENPDERWYRYQSRTAVLNLLTLADTIQSHHAGSRAQQRKTLDALRRLISSALAEHVERDEE
jgi:hypothetical protein